MRPGDIFPGWIIKEAERMKQVLSGIACSLALLITGFMPGVASAITIAISWTGSGGYTMSGTMIYNDSLIGTGAIDETDVDSLTIEGFLNNVSIGTWDLADGSTTTFNLNYDTDTQSFIVGGSSTGTSGQTWNWQGDTGLGFISGSPNQLLSLDGSNIPASVITTASGTLTATVVPVPAAAYLFGSGLVGLIGFARRKQRPVRRI